MRVVTGLDELTARAINEIESVGIPSVRRHTQLAITSKRHTIERPRDLAPFIEHTQLRPEATYQSVIKLCTEATENNFRGVCVNPAFVEDAKARLLGTNCLLVTVVGFPLGANLSSTKVQETKAVVEAGADEVDMVIPIGILKSGDYKRVFEDIRTVIEAAGHIPVKVILEMALLDEYQKVIGCLLAERAGAAFVKTSTGFAGGGATVEDVRLMNGLVGGRMAIKAAGGIRDFESARAIVEAGADRLGCSSSVAIVSGSA